MSIFEIILFIAALLLGGVSLYFKYNKKLASMAAGLIAEAEKLYRDVTKAGGIKFEWVVERLYSFLPTPLKLIFSRELLAGIVQKMFDAIQEYAKIQLDKAADILTERSEKKDKKKLEQP